MITALSIYLLGFTATFCGSLWVMRGMPAEDHPGWRVLLVMALVWPLTAWAFLRNIWDD